MSDSNTNSSNTGDRSLSDVLNNLIARLDSGNAGVSGQLQSITNAASTAISAVTQGTTIAAQTGAVGSMGKEIVNLVNPMNNGGSTMTNVLTSLFLGPIWKGLFGLFTGGGDDPAPVLTKYQFPDATATNVAASAPDGSPALTRSDAFGVTRSAPNSPASIQVSIQALDARSILDRSDDIANALRQAMLSNHEVNDSLSEF
ncbi:hypothetical protein [Bryobacter aggregatus]|uniref:hypothetical protein n=1 Tax=Bryobacter aggregatus TaxID=360054 RepID=UPI0004E2700D|nr:hypothetical protein [Bryobacter aggregatus]